MERSKIKICGHEILKKTPFVEFVQTKYMNTNNKLAHWAFARRPKGRKAVVIAAVNEDNKLIVIREYRVPIEGYELGFPAGLIDAGENPEDAVRRELGEETGLKVEEIMHISPAVLSSAGITDEAIHMAYVKVSGTPNKDKLEASEDIDTFMLDREEVGTLMGLTEDAIGKSAYCVMRNFVKFGEI